MVKGSGKPSTHATPATNPKPLSTSNRGRALPGYGGGEHVATSVSSLLSLSRAHGFCDEPRWNSSPAGAEETNQQYRQQHHSQNYLRRRHDT